MCRYENPAPGAARYTQNVHEQWPYYFREQMFHKMLNEHGYLVRDMDYQRSVRRD